jgi:transmembrane protein TMEM260 (protein O-mannosyltransferase)
LRSGRIRLARYAFLIVPLLFYYRTSAPGIGSSDTALMVGEMQSLDLSTHANHHNLTLIVGRLFLMAPGKEPARLANLGSVLLGSVAIGLLYLIVLKRTGSPLVAACGAAAVMVSHSMWWHSTVVEAYAWNAIFVVGALGLLQRLAKEHSDRALLALFFVAGLAFFNHVQMGILLVGAGAYLAGHLLLRRQQGEGAGSLRLTLRCAAAFLLGFAPYALTFAHDVVRFGARRAAAWALGGDFQSVMAKGSAATALSDVFFLGALQFPSPFLAAVLGGAVLLVRAWRGTAALLALAALFTLNTVFFAFYNTWDKFAFLLPSFLVLGYAGTFGVERAFAWAKGRTARMAIAFAMVAASLVLPPFVYARLHEWSRYGGPLARYRSPESPVDSSGYVANPDKSRCTEFEDYVRTLFARLPEGATYIDDDGRAFYPVRYFQEQHGMRRDVRTELLNYWGFGGWGLSPEQLAMLATEAHASGRPFFLVAIGEPYYGVIVRSPALERLRFRRFPLDARRTIYRLVPAAEEGALPPEPPRGASLWTAAAPPPPESPTSTAAPPADHAPHQVGARDPVVAVLEFEPNGEPFDVEFRWRKEPDSAPAAVARLKLPFGVRRVWSELDLPRPLAAGAWRVEAVVNGSVLAGAAFDVR